MALQVPAKAGREVTVAIDRGHRAAAGCATVRFQPPGREVSIPIGSSLLEAARAAGLPLGSSCDGRGSCGWCRVSVVSGADALSACAGEERRILERIGAGPRERLACLARLLGDVTITTTYW